MSCCSLEHQLVVKLSAGIVVVQIHLVNYRNFFKRVSTGFKYIFGYKSKYGDWDEMVLDESHIEQLEETLKYLKGKENETTYNY